MYLLFVVTTFLFYHKIFNLQALSCKNSEICRTIYSENKHKSSGGFIHLVVTQKYREEEGRTTNYVR